MVHRKKSQYLTKSNYVTGLSCAKEVWLKFNNPDALPEVDAQTQHRFDEGNKVGELAKSLFKNGIDIKEIDPKENDRKSRELLKKRKPLFEAGFLHKDGWCYARADILLPAPGGCWDVLEVKSTTEVKDEHLEDVSFQRYCYGSAGVRIRKCFVVHANREFVRHGEVDPNEFFARSEVTKEVNALMHEVPTKIKTISRIIKQRKCPEFGHGEEFHKDENGMHLNDRFWREHPDADVPELFWGGRKAIELFNEGIIRMRDIPEERLTDRQVLQRRAHMSGRHHVDIKQIGSFLSGLSYPLRFMDFESYSTAIPLYDGLRPYQQVPFQFSVHVVQGRGQGPRHHSFIASGSGDPRPMFIRELRRALGAGGSIVVYNQAFEIGVLKGLAVLMPRYSGWVGSTMARIVDLYVPFRGLAYYHPAQRGSASLKSVLPALTGISYGGLGIGSGTGASLAYLFITHGAYDGRKATKAEVRKVRKDLERYCGQDTGGLVKVLERLEGFVAP